MTASEEKMSCEANLIMMRFRHLKENIKEIVKKFG